MKRALLVALNAHFMHTNLAVRQLSCAAEGQKIATEVMEAHINLPYRRLLEDILRTGADCVGFSCYIWNVSLTFRLCRALHLARPGITIFVGGPEVSHRAAQVLADCPAIDFVLAGEGEISYPALLEHLSGARALSDCPGLYWRELGVVRCGPAAACLPPEAWPDVYAGGIGGLTRRILYLETSRGCPFGCSYCLSGREGGVRALPAAESVRRLTFLADGGASLVKLVDRTFNFDRARALAIWNGLIDHALATGHKAVFHFEIAAHLIGDAESAALARAPKGLFQMEAGIQSANAQVLENVGRAVPFDRVAEGMGRLKVLGNIPLHADLIAGLPGESLSSFARSFDRAWGVDADQLQLGFLKLLYGSKLRGSAAEQGIVFEPDAPYEVLFTREMTGDDLLLLKDVETVLDWYANSGRYRGALKLLLTDRSPFQLLRELAEQLRKDGTLSLERGEKARAEALLRVGSRMVGGAVLGGLMRHDLLLAGRRRDLPESLDFTEDAAERALLRERFHPVRGQSTFLYPFDPEAFLRGEGVQWGETRVVYAGANVAAE